MIGFANSDLDFTIIGKVKEFGDYLTTITKLVDGVLRNES